VAPVGPWRLPVATGTATVVCSTRADGDLHAERVALPVLTARWAAITGRPTTWLDEVHGTDVVEVRRPGAGCGVTADAVVTTEPGVALGVWVGDCAPVVLVGESGAVAAVHAGWKGLRDGVIEAAVFGPDDLAGVEAVVGAAARGTTSWGTGALDVPGAVAAELARLGVAHHDLDAPCTACDTDYWSHRARGELGRQGMAVWVDAA
jgi:copper oxidase (laccase) domain-containing protein